MQAAPVNDDSFRDTLYVITALENDQPKTITVKIAGKDFTFTDKNTTDKDNNLKTTTNDSFICEQKNPTTGITITGKPQPIPGGGSSYAGFITVNYMNNTDEKCTNNADEIVVKLPINPVYNAPGTGGGAGTVGNDEAPDVCYIDSGGFPLAWVFCPLLSAGNALANEMLNLFQDQLSFTVNQDLGNQDSQNRVKLAWSLVKNISSAGLVIIMLIMVFSQAVGSGLFDAYTIKKILPRLAIAAIVMQLSWALFGFVVNLVNDIGNGLAAFMFAPFGGSDNLELGALLANAGISVVEAAAINWVALIAVVGLAAAALPTTLFLVFAAIVALFTALVTLVLRKIIIIMCLILAPLALLAWILPGTQRYWKLWADNFTKVLVMFPIIIAIVASGRIFAYVVGTQDNNKFLSLILVLVGFFGPLFLLPKAFKWGGSAMAYAGNAASSFGGNVKKVSEKPIKEYGQLRQGSIAKQYNPDASRGRRALSRIGSGHFLPTERSRRLTIRAGDQWAADRNEEATAYAGRVSEIAMSKGYTAYELDKNGNRIKDANGKDVIAKDKNGNERVWTPGVGAAKQALIDLAGTDQTSDHAKRAGQAAAKQLIDTSSWIELQGSTITRGANAGKRIFDAGANEIWEKTLTTSPEHYSKTLRSRPDLVPHMLQYTYGDNKVKDLYPEEFAGIDSSNHDAVAAKAAQVRQRRGLNKNQRLSDADRMIMSIKDQMNPEDLSSVAQGFYQEIARLGDAQRGGNPVDGQRVSNALHGVLKGLADTGLPGQQVIARLSGGSLGEDVNKALANGTASNNIDDYLHHSQASGRGRPAPPPANQQTAGTQAAATPGSSQGGPIGGDPSVLKIDHDALAGAVASAFKEVLRTSPQTVFHPTEGTSTYSPPSAPAEKPPEPEPPQQPPSA